MDFDQLPPAEQKTMLDFCRDLAAALNDISKNAAIEKMGIATLAEEKDAKDELPVSIHEG